MDFAATKAVATVERFIEKCKIQQAKLSKVKYEKKTKQITQKEALNQLTMQSYAVVAAAAVVVAEATTTGSPDNLHLQHQKQQDKNKQQKQVDRDGCCTDYCIIHSKLNPVAD